MRCESTTTRAVSLRNTGDDRIASDWRRLLSVTTGKEICCVAPVTRHQHPQNAGLSWRPLAPPWWSGDKRPSGQWTVSFLLASTLDVCGGSISDAEFVEIDCGRRLLLQSGRLAAHVPFSWPRVAIHRVKEIFLRRVYL